MTSVVVGLFDAAFNTAAFLVPWTIGAQIVLILGPTDNPLWVAKEVLGAFAAGIATVPFAVALYPQNLSILFESDPIWLWTLRVCAERAAVGLFLFFMLTAYGIYQRGWHGTDELGWRQLPLNA